MPTENTAQIEAIAGALALMLERRSLDQPPPSWITEFLEALAPLKALSPAHGELPKQDAARLSEVQDALRRADLSKATRPEDSDCIYLAISVFQRGGKK